MHGPNLREVDELHAIEAEVVRDFDEEEERHAGSESGNVVGVEEVGYDAGFDGQHDHTAEDADGHEFVAVPVVVDEAGDSLE
jgi:hypothetical protein